MTNVVMINGKIRRELDKVDGSIDLLARRSKEIDKIIQEEEAKRKKEKESTDKNQELGKLPTYVDMESFVKELKKVWEFNQKINLKFSNLKDELSKFEALNSLFEKMDDIQSMVI